MSGKFVVQSKGEGEERQHPKKNKKHPRLGVSPENTSHIITYCHIKSNVWGLWGSLDEEMEGG